MRLAGDLIGDVDERGEPIVDDTALILLNAHHEPIPFTLPQTLGGQVWERVLDTSQTRRRTAASCAGATSSTSAIARWPSCSRGRSTEVSQPRRREPRSRLCDAKPAGRSLLCPGTSRPLEKPDTPVHRRR